MDQFILHPRTHVGGVLLSFKVSGLGGPGKKDEADDDRHGLSVRLDVRRSIS